MVKAILAILIGTGLILSACQQPDPIGVPGEKDKPKDTLPITPAWTAPEKSCTGEILWRDIDWEENQAHDSGTYLAGDSLITTYEFGGGCRAHTFTPICTDYHQGLTTGRATLWVRHTGSEDPCLALFTKRFAFDASAIKAKAGEGTTYRVRFLQEPHSDFLKPQGPPVASISQATADSMASHSAHFNIERTRLSGDSLYVWVIHGGGCQDHYYPGYASSHLLKSNPPQMDFWIYHVDNEDHCKGLVGGILVYDVSDLIGTAPGVTFRVHALTP